MDRELPRRADGPSVNMREPISIVVIHPEGNHLNNPTLYELEKTIRHKGGDIHFLPGDIGYKKNKSSIPSRILRKIFNIVYHIAPFRGLQLIVLAIYVNQLHMIKRSSVIAGVDHVGIIQANVLAKTFKLPLIYFSFEIMFSDEIGEKRKAVEIDSCIDVRSCFVQDKARSALLAAENHLNGRCILIPVGNSGSPEPSSMRLRDELGIPSNKKVAIFVGSLAEWTLASKVVEEFCLSTTSEWTLILHGRYGEIPEWMASARKNNAKKIYISSMPRDFDKMSDLFNGVSLGFAFYNEVPGDPFLGKNIRHIGLSSGKISTYLRHGIPVITNATGELAELINNYGAGIVALSVAEAIARINEITPEMHEPARRLFVDVLDYRKHESKILEELLLIQHTPTGIAAI